MMQVRSLERTGGLRSGGGRWIVLTVVFGVMCLVGTAGWIMSIIGTFRDEQRLAGILGIVLRLLAGASAIGIQVFSLVKA